ncbi:hypothetical protein [Granulicella sibirica]|uniref:hypothetical protein n=1 Tax=Granulicella sibirica TaxID=2479048 RepID=UPI0010092A9F|nr:hypothetical protein [Granulicella sibirica]
MHPKFLPTAIKEGLYMPEEGKTDSTGPTLISICIAIALLFVFSFITRSIITLFGSSTLSLLLIVALGLASGYGATAIGAKVNPSASLAAIKFSLIAIVVLLLLIDISTMGPIPLVGQICTVVGVALAKRTS